MEGSLKSVIDTFTVKGFPFQFYNDPIYGVTIITCLDCPPSTLKMFFDLYAEDKQLLEDFDYEEYISQEKVWAFTVRTFNLDKKFYTKNNVYQKAVLLFFDKRNKKISPQVINTISHESLHASLSILQNAGLELSEESEESFTYYTGFISEVVFISLMKLIKKK